MEVISRLRKVSVTHVIALTRLPYKLPFKTADVEQKLIEFEDVPKLIQHLSRAGYVKCVTRSHAKQHGNTYVLTPRGAEIVNLFETLMEGH